MIPVSTVAFAGFSITLRAEFAASAAQGGIMTSQVDRSPDRETCSKLISLGYARSNRVRLYGQEVQLVSDPFPEEGGIAIEVVGQNDSVSRRMKLPLSILQMTAKKRVA